MQMTCIATSCYMPVIRDGDEIQYRFEEGDVVEVPESKVRQFRRTGNFVENTEPVETPIYVEEPEEVEELSEEEEETEEEED